MSLGAVMIGLVLLGQVSGGNGRYPAASGTNPFNQVTPAGNPASSASGNNGVTGFAPMVETPAQGIGTGQGTASPIAPSARPANPYAPAATSPPGASGVYPPPGVGSPTNSPSGTSPWQAAGASGGAATHAANSDGGSKPAAMMRAMLLVAPSGSRLPGTPISLSDAVASASSRADQSERVEAYWDLCSSVADYYLGVREQDELQRLRGRMQRVDTSWQQAETEMAVRVGTSQAAAIASQYRLASLMGIGGSLPLPADIPHCGDYHTRYNEIFVGRSSVEAAELAKLLPQRFAELKSAALAVTRAEQELETTASRSDGEETRRALELLALRRRAFVQIARDYNRRIARYTELSTPGDVASERLIGMLIKSSATSTATRTSAPAPYNRQSQNAPSLPKTFGEGWEPASGEKIGDSKLDEAIKQTSAEAETATVEPPRQERSLLVKPQ